MGHKGPRECAAHGTIIRRQLVQEHYCPPDIDIFIEGATAAGTQGRIQHAHVASIRFSDLSISL